MKKLPIYLPYLSQLDYQTRAEELISPYPTIGIMGGMGPDATAYLYQAIIDLTRKIGKAESDQEHLPVLIASYPQIPDRTKFILSWLNKTEKSSEDPFPYLVRSYMDLKPANESVRQRVKYVGIPCATAHFFVPMLQEYIRKDGSEIELVHMLEETEKMIHSVRPAVKKVGVLATSGTLEAQLYQVALESRGFEVIAPQPLDQEELVMDAIYGQISGKGIKGGYTEEPREKLLLAALKLKQAGAEVIIAGCTEIPLALKQEHLDVLLINPTEVLARRLVELTLASKYLPLEQAATV